MTDYKERSQTESNKPTNNNGDDYAALREPEDQNKVEQVGNEPFQGPNLGGMIGAVIGLCLFGALGVIVPRMGMIGVNALITGAIGAFVGALAGWMIGSLFGVTMHEEHKQH